jgi:hypothetical protein
VSARVGMCRKCCAHLRIPYAPFYSADRAMFGSTMRSDVSAVTGNAHPVLSLVLSPR